MRHRRHTRWQLVATVIAAAAGLVSTVAMVGEPARLPAVLTVFFSGFASGAALASWLHARRTPE